MGWADATNVEQARETVAVDGPVPNQDQAMLALVRANHMTHVSHMTSLPILADTCGRIVPPRLHHPCHGQRR